MILIYTQMHRYIYKQIHRYNDTYLYAYIGTWYIYTGTQIQ